MFGALVRLCGLNSDEASKMLGIKRRIIVSWLRNQGAPPQEVMQKLYRLHEAQEKAADEIIEAWKTAGEPHSLTLKIAASEEDAQESGWPSVNAQLVPVAIAQATLTELTIGFETAPEGETNGSA